MRKKTARKSTKPQATRRNFYVFTSLASALTLTGTLLLVLSPQPLRPDMPSTLSAIGTSPDTLTPVNPAPGRWQYIYVHQSRSNTPPAPTTDHFLITPAGIQTTALWASQVSALPPTPGSSIDPSCISICLVGDFDSAAPAPAQHHHLAQLINSLQNQLHLPSRCLIMLDQPDSSASIGKLFPVTDFHSQLLR